MPSCGVERFVRTPRAATWICRGACIALTVVISGYVSALISVVQCEKAAADEVARELGDRDVFVLRAECAGFGYRGSEAILLRSGFSVRACDASQGFSCFPWAAVANGTVKYPFLVDVRWGFVAAPLGGWGIRTRYFALFGLVIPVRDFGEWVT